LILVEVAVLVAVVAGIEAYTCFAPVYSVHWFGANPRGPIFRYTAQASSSFYEHGCGMVYNLSVSVNGGPERPAAPNPYGWECWASRPGGPVETTYSVPPLSTNVTVQFANVTGRYDFTVTTMDSVEGRSSYGGSDNQSFSYRITPVFEGETITISASEESSINCIELQGMTVSLYLDGKVAAQGTAFGCTSSSIHFSYTI
jgi:hypothetical protein